MLRGEEAIELRKVARVQGATRTVRESTVGMVPPQSQYIGENCGTRSCVLVFKLFALSCFVSPVQVDWEY